MQQSRKRGINNVRHADAHPWQQHKALEEFSQELNTLRFCKYFIDQILYLESCNLDPENLGGLAAKASFPLLRS